MIDIPATLAESMGFKIHEDGSITTVHEDCGCTTHPFGGLGRRLTDSTPVPSTVTDHELQTVNLINMLEDHHKNSCAGPLIIHSSGAAECHGTACPGITLTGHSMGATDPCMMHQEKTMTHPCGRCD